MSGVFVCKVSEECSNGWHYLECPNFRAEIQIQKGWFWWKAECKSHNTGTHVIRRSRDRDKAIQKCAPYVANRKPSYEEIKVKYSGGKLVEVKSQ